MPVSLLKNFFSLVGAEIFSKLLTFAAFAFLARRLGAANFGFIEWAAAVLMCAGLIVDQGFGFYGAREVAKTPERAADLLAEIVGARFILAIIAFGIVAALAFGLENAESLRNLLLLYGLSLFAAPLLLGWIFQGLEDMRTVAVINLIRQIVFASIVFAFVRGGAELWLAAVAEIAAVSIAAAFGIWTAKKKLALPLKINFRFSGELFRAGLPIGLSQMFWTIKMFGATLIVGFVATAEDTGYFAGAMRIYIALHTFVWFYYFNLLPSMSRRWEAGRESFAELIGGSMRIVALIALPAGIVWILAAPTVMIGVYGRNFAGGAGALQWLAGACVAAAISGHYRFGLIAGNFQTGEMLTSALGALMAAILIPVGYFNFGVSGAAAALFIAEIGVLIFAWLVARRTLFNADLPPENCLKSLSEAT